MASVTAETTEQPVIPATVVPEERGGLPQLRPETFPSQVFWLAVTFGLLFLFFWRVVLPRIKATMRTRRQRIEGDLAEAERLRSDANTALAAYEAALSAARSRALALADENRRRVLSEIEQLKAAADADAQAAIIEAEGRIAADRSQAEKEVRSAAADVASAIVERLIGVSVSVSEAKKAVAAGGKKG